MLEVPERLNRNAKCVRDMGDPADTGRMLIDYMCERIGIPTLAGLDILDLGCGVRFSQSIINRDLPIGTYTGLDVDEEIVQFLCEKVTDPRFAYHHVDTLNTYYNPNGKGLDLEAPSPLGEKKFDVACMFSVITHQNPQEAAPLFRFLRRHINGDGWLFFSAFTHEEHVPYKERNPDRPGNKSSYSVQYMTKLLDDAGWAVSSVVDPRPNGIPIQTSILCRPRPTV